MTIDIQRVRGALEGRAHRLATRTPNDTSAAVAAVLRDRNGRAEVLLIRRATQENDPWSGHMALPGGRQDPGDRDLRATAIRETWEEVGLALDPEANFLGELDDLHAMARGRRVGLIIAPFVFAIDGDPLLEPSPGEVSECLWVPLSALASGECDSTYEYRLDDRLIRLPAYDVDGRIIWGLTHRMLGTLFEVLDGKPRSG